MGGKPRTKATTTSKTEDTPLYKRVRKLCLARVKEAVDTGKRVQSGGYGDIENEDVLHPKSGNQMLDPVTGDYLTKEVPSVCGIGAIALNGDSMPEGGLRPGSIKDKPGSDPSSIFAITSALLIKEGMSLDDIGFVLDAIETGFEGASCAHYKVGDVSADDLESMKFAKERKYLEPEIVEFLEKWGAYIKIGQEIRERFAVDGD